MIGDAHLPADDHSFAKLAAAADTCLCGNDGVLPDRHVVRDLDKIVDLHAAFDQRQSSEPRSTAELQPISTSSPISTVPICGNLLCLLSPKT